MHRRIFVTILLASGCGAESVGPTERPQLEGTSTVVPVSEGVAVPALPEASPEDAPLRARRRMDVDQLDASLRRFSGGIGWMVGNRNRLQDLAPTLGRPDYIQIVDEDLTPSAMFQKFLDDAARSVCADLMAADPDRPPTERTFFIDATPSDGPETAPEATRSNLRQLLLRAHGTRPSDSQLEPWTFLMQSIMQVGGTGAEAWNTVCVGLLTHPDFFTY